MTCVEYILYSTYVILSLKIVLEIFKVYTYELFNIIYQTLQCRVAVTQEVKHLIPDLNNHFLACDSLKSIMAVL